MFASSFLILFLLHLFHFTFSAHLLLFPLIPCPPFLPHCPLLFSFLIWQTACLFLFSFPVSLLFLPLLSYFLLCCIISSSYFLSLHYPLPSLRFFFFIYLPISFPFHTYLHIQLLAFSVYHDACFIHPHGYPCTPF